jgi:hypothetical protein
MNECSSNNAYSESIQGKIDLLFVQLGFEKSRHLIQNIKLIHGMFPDILIHCVISKGSVLEQDLPTFVNRIVYTAEKRIDELFDSKNIDLDFRRGYWRYTLERLIAIKSAYDENPKSKFIHIESDVFLLPSFPFSNFQSIENVAWLPYGGTRDIASIMYFPSLEKNSQFTDDLLVILLSNLELTDMQALNILRNTFPERYSLLPSSNMNFPNLLNTSVLSTSSLNTVFEGIFDSAPIGMWLTGIDPKNYFGVTRYFETIKIEEMNTFIQPNAYSLKFVNSQELFYEANDNSLQIYNLHLHSKSKKIFSPQWSSEIKRLVTLSSTGKVYSEFSIKLFFELIFSNLLKGTLIEYIYNSPLFFNVRRFKHYLRRKNNRR